MNIITVLHVCVNISFQLRMYNTGQKMSVSYYKKDLQMRKTLNKRI